MSSETVPDSSAELPAEHVTIDQLVALNVRYWRRKARLTQAELGERIGWSAPNVSAAELSADPSKDKRRFDAHTLVALAMALDVPLIALFMPPPDDGIRVRYLFHAHEHGADCSDMAELFLFLMPEGTDAPVADEWRGYFAGAVSRYMDPGRGAEFITYLDEMTTAEQRAARLERISGQRQAILSLLSDLDQQASAIENAEDMP